MKAGSGKGRKYSQKDKKGRTVTVKDESALLPFLFELLSGQSKSSVKSMLKHGQISVNKRVTSQFDTPLKVGDQVGISYEWGKVEFSHPLLKVIWEDDLLLITNKREGLLAAGNNRTKERTAFMLLKDYLKKNDPRSRLFLLNPLDRDTSGLMIFAKNRGIQQQFLDNWNGMVPYRSFATVVQGKPEKNEGLLVSDHMEDEKVVVAATGKSAATIMRYKVLKSNGDYSLLKLIQESGKRNDAREKLDAMGCPVVGDRLSESVEDDPLGRVAMHADRLEIIHPETGERMGFDSRYPSDFNVLVKK